MEKRRDKYQQAGTRMESPGQQKSWRTKEDTEENGEGGEREAKRLATNRVR